MNGTVFIGWSSSNNLASDIAEKLKDKRFDCIVGGDKDLEGNLSIANTIVDQIKSSTQAIFIIRKNNIGYISNNVIFEIGYCLSKFNSTLRKLHLFYLDIDYKDDAIPSDLLGVWAHHLDTSDMTQDELEDVIVEKFMKHQKSELDGNKMDMVLDWFSLYSVLSNHLVNPKNSDYDIAQYMMLFTESSGISHMQAKMAEIVKEMSVKVSEYSTELYYILKYALATDELQHSFSYNGNERYLDSSTQRRLRRGISGMLSSVKRYSSDGSEYSVDPMFALWFELLCEDRIMYYYLLHSNDPSLSAESKESVMESAEKKTVRVLELCEMLMKVSPEKNREFVTYFRAMGYRNLAIIAAYRGDIDREKEYRLRTFEDEVYLKERYENRIIDQRMGETRERAYYVAMAEALKFMDDDEDRNDCREELAEYTDRMLHLRDSTGMYVNRINSILNGGGPGGL